MWTLGYRAMTSEEREELRDLLDGCSSSRWQPVGAIAGALVAVTASLVWTSESVLLLTTLVLGGLFGSLGAWAVSGRRRSALRDAIRRDLLGGKVQVFQVMPREVVRLTTPGGSVAGYFAGIGGGQIMFIEPRDWEDAEDASGGDFERLFPCRRFSLARAPRSKVDLGFTCDGERIPPLRDIPLASEALPGDWVQDGDVFWANLETLEGRLRVEAFGADQS